MEMTKAVNYCLAYTIIFVERLVKYLIRIEIKLLQKIKHEKANYPMQSAREFLCKYRCKEV